MATGVLVLCLGKATRLIPYIEEAGGAEGKEYEAGIRFGFETTTDDAEGERRGPMTPLDELTRQSLVAALEAAIGEVEQVPPAYSAKKVDGERAYTLARRGENVELKPVRVSIRSADLIGLVNGVATVRFVCSRGTYIRALARDLGRTLGLGAHLVTLRRTRSGTVGLAGAIPLDQLDAASLAGNLRPMASILDAWPRVEVSGEAAADLRLGRAITVAAIPGDREGRVRVCDGADNLVALARASGERLQPFCVF